MIISVKVTSERLPNEDEDNDSNAQETGSASSEFDVIAKRMRQMRVSSPYLKHRLSWGLQKSRFLKLCAKTMKTT